MLGAQVHRYLAARRAAAKWFLCFFCGGAGSYPLSAWPAWSEPGRTAAGAPRSRFL